MSNCIELYWTTQEWRCLFQTMVDTNVGTKKFRICSRHHESDNTLDGVKRVLESGTPKLQEHRI